MVKQESLGPSEGPEMKEIRIPKLLQEYINWVNDDEVDFLKESSDDVRQKIVALIEVLKRQVEDAERAGDRGQNLKWYEAHKTGGELWEQLASAALNHIDKDSKGNDKLFKFLKRATEFEDLLYGLDIYYRDHTLHSLWVYFIGEHILRKRLCGLRKRLNWYLFNDIEAYEEQFSYTEEFVDFAKKKQEKLNGKVGEDRDAVWCIMALCHDLGYSLAKLRDLNDKVQNVLEFFDVSNFMRVGYSLDIEHQHLISQFLELMAMDVRIVPGEDYKEALKKLKQRNKKGKLGNDEYDKKMEEVTLIKCYRDDSTYWRLCRALEKKQHGILGAYLIYKILGIFADTSVRGPAEDWGLEDEEVPDNIIRGDILFAIAQHTFDFAHSYELNSLGDILILADELEEFSRYGRQLTSREYHDTMAQSSVGFKVREEKKTRRIRKEGRVFEKPEVETYVTINILYQVAKEHSLIDFFTRKAESLCKFYSLDPKQDKQAYKPVFYKIENIKMVAEKNQYVLEFHFGKGPEHKLTVKHKREIAEVPLVEYMLVCHDDKLKLSDKDEKLKHFLESIFHFDNNKIVGIKTETEEREEKKEESKEE